jgi:hypothetical protein
MAVFCSSLILCFPGMFVVVVCRGGGGSYKLCVSVGYSPSLCFMSLIILSF